MTNKLTFRFTSADVIREARREAMCFLRRTVTRLHPVKGVNVSHTQARSEELNLQASIFYQIYLRKPYTQ